MEAVMAKDSRTHIIAASRVEGTAVYNTAGEKLGTVSDVMLDKISGKVAFALMSFGGFLGVGSKMHPLPWSVMRYDSDRGGYVVNLDKNTLMEAPTVERDADFNWADEDWGRRIYEYYKGKSA
jgi:hypothetical protein